MQEIKLTQFSPGAGCGCKISPKDLEEILKTNTHYPVIPGLLVGYASKDDAAVYDLGNNSGLIFTTDFFTPIVDDPYDYGRIAATNAISDIYAMGGKPILALAILGWPLEKLSAEIAKKVIEGAREVCAQVNISLGGGHSIDVGDPIFGLAVNGIAPLENIKRNDQAKAGDILFLSKPLGVGILSTAQKKGILQSSHEDLALRSMLKLNQLGEKLGFMKDVSAMTDVTGFGLLGHLLEVCEGSGVTATLNLSKIPCFPGLDSYIAQKAIPGGTYRNFKSYGHKVAGLTEQGKFLLCDPQTSGGLLVAVKEKAAQEFLDMATQEGYVLEAMGRLLPKENTAQTLIEILP